MDERRHSVANPEVCATYCHVPRDLPLLERNLSEIDVGKSHTVTGDKAGEPSEEISQSPVPPEGYAFTVADSSLTTDEFCTKNKQKLVINLDMQHDSQSNSDSTPASMRGDDRCRLAPPEPSFENGSSSAVSVNDSEHSRNAPKEPDSSLHMDNLKTMTERLHLTTRRPSYIVWKKKYIDDAPNGRYLGTYIIH